MSSKSIRVLDGLRQSSFSQWATTFWLLKRRLVGGDAAYSALRVSVDSKLSTKLRHLVVDLIKDKGYELEDYSFLSADQDRRIFTVEAEGTDFVKIQSEIEKGLQNNKAQEFEDLLNSWAYVVQLKHGDEVLYGVRKINALTQTKKVKSLKTVLFKDHVLTDIEDERVFTIDRGIDFFVFKDIVFITNKKEFESTLNFRKGMEDNRDSLLREFEELRIFSDVDSIRGYVGANLHHLRKISAIQKSAYYKDSVFIQNMINLNKTEHWGLTIVNNRIMVDETNVELVLTLLNNSRLKSPINQEVFDAQVKKKVG